MVQSVVCFALTLAYWSIIGWIILSYVVAYGRIPSDHPVRKLFDALERIMQPLLRPIRAVLPPVSVGSVRLDLSPIVLFVVILVIQWIIC